METLIVWVGNAFWVIAVGLWAFTAISYIFIENESQRNLLLLLCCAIGIALMGTVMFVGLEIAKPLREIAQTLKHLSEVYDYQVVKPQ